MPRGMLGESMAVLGQIARMGLFAQIFRWGGLGWCCGGTGAVPRGMLGKPMAVLGRFAGMGLFAQIPLMGWFG